MKKHTQSENGKSNKKTKNIKIKCLKKASETCWFERKTKWTVTLKTPSSKSGISQKMK